MKRSDLEYIQRAFANTRPDFRTAPILEHDIWRRLVREIGHAFAQGPFRHLHNPHDWEEGTGILVREPAPREGEPYEQDGYWYNLTDSEATSRGLIPDPSAPRWFLPRNVDGNGNVIVDPYSNVIMDAVTGDWRDMTEAERIQYGRPDPLAIPPEEGREGAGRVYCRNRNAEGSHFCTMPPGHTGPHEAIRENGTRYCNPWPQAATPRARIRPRCTVEFEDDSGNVHRCEGHSGHSDDHWAHDEDGEEITWED